MDSVRFDAIAQRLAKATSRRATFRGLVVAALAPALGVLGGEAEAAPEGERCVDLGDKCSKGKKGKRGKKADKCCGKGRCQGGRCKCGRGRKECNGRCIKQDACCRNANGECVTVVTPENLKGWGFYDDQIDERIAPDFVAGPATPPLGEGSARLAVVGATEGKILSANILLGTKLADVSELRYSTYQTTSSGGASPTLQLGIDFDLTDNNTEWMGRLVYVPNATQQVNEDEWQTWDVLDDAAGTGSGNWFFTRQQPENGSNGACPQNNKCTWAEVLAAFPNIGISTVGDDAKNGAGRGFIGFKVGSGDSNLDANVDKLEITIDGAKSVFNFEPDAQ